MIVNTHINTFSDIGYIINISQGEKLSVPVSRVNYVYSNFEHVSGVQAPEGGKGVTISKLKILDVLIDQLSQVKEGKKDALGLVSDERIDALIEQYEQQIRQTKTMSMNIPYFPALEAPMGMLFNLVA